MNKLVSRHRIFRRPYRRDQMLFLKNWLFKPKSIGAVCASSTRLAGEMARRIDTDISGKVLELGPGTGVVTEAILTRGVARKDMLLVEYNPVFGNLLKERFPDIEIIGGDAFDLPQLLPDMKHSSLCAIVSSLPLVNFLPEQRVKLLNDCLNFLQPGAPFIQFSYSPTAPICAKFDGITCEKSSWILGNVPPARVWVYRRSQNGA